VALYMIVSAEDKRIEVSDSFTGRTLWVLWNVLYLYVDILCPSQSRLREKSGSITIEQDGSTVTFFCII